MRRTCLLLLVATACFDPETTEGEDGGSGTGGGTSTDGTTSTTAADETNATTDATTTATTGVDSSSSSPGSSDGASETTTGDLPPICDQQMPTLAACGTAGTDDTPNYGNLACDATVADFSVFYEDIYTLDLAMGQCVYVHADNVGASGLLGGPSSDIAFQLRSPSDAYAWQDDDVACTESAWTGGSCRRACSPPTSTGRTSSRSSRPRAPVASRAGSTRSTSRSTGFRWPPP